MKSKLVVSGNLAVFEYPSGGVDHEFTLEETGVLWIFGYVMPFNGQIIRVMKRFETGLIGYKIVGKHVDAKFSIQGNYDELLFGLDEHRCLVMVKLLLNIEPNDKPSVASKA